MDPYGIQQGISNMNQFQSSPVGPGFSTARS